MRRRFQREAQILAEAAHRHVIAVYDIGEYQRRPYFVMEFVDGMTLSEYLAGCDGGLPVDVALGFAWHICDAVGRVHSLGMIHRDIKPANVMITPANEALLMDFGLAQESGGRTGGLVSGTPQYLAPEDVRGLPLSGEDARRSDIYALGVTLYELLAGKPPFDDRDCMKVLQSHLNDLPRPLSELRPDVPASLERVVMSALEKDPALRPASCTAFIDGLRAARSGTAPEAGDASPPLVENRPDSSRFTDEIRAFLEATDSVEGRKRNWGS